jgi:hypothetical protein
MTIELEWPIFGPSENDSFSIMPEIPDFFTTLQPFDLGVVSFERVIHTLLEHALSVHFRKALYSAWVKVPKFSYIWGIKNGAFVFMYFRPKVPLAEVYQTEFFIIDSP